MKKKNIQMHSKQRIKYRRNLMNCYKIGKKWKKNIGTTVILNPVPRDSKTSALSLCYERVSYILSVKNKPIHVSNISIVTYHGEPTSVNPIQLCDNARLTPI